MIIGPNFEYASPVWDPYHKIETEAIIESVSEVFTENVSQLMERRLQLSIFGCQTSLIKKQSVQLLICKAFWLAFYFTW